MKLFTKGLLLIALPSIVELALLGVVFDTQEQTAQAVQSAANSRQILYQASSLADPLLRQAARVRTGLIVGDAAFIDRHAVWVDLSDRLAHLEQLVGDTPQQAARVNAMRDAIGSYHTQALAVAQALREGRSVKPYAALEGQAMPAQVEAV